jgi:hypothetical protein
MSNVMGGRGMHPSAVLGKLRAQRDANELAGGVTGTGMCLHARTARATLHKGAPLHVLICEDCGSIGPTNQAPTIGEWTAPRLFASQLAGGAPPSPAAARLPAVASAPPVPRIVETQGTEVDEEETAEFRDFMHDLFNQWKRSKGDARDAGR